VAENGAREGLFAAPLPPHPDARPHRRFNRRRVDICKKLSENDSFRPLFRRSFHRTVNAARRRS